MSTGINWMLIAYIIAIILPIFLIHYYLEKNLEEINNIELPAGKSILYAIISIILWWIFWNTIAILLVIYAKLIPIYLFDIVKIIGGLVWIYTILFVVLKYIEKVDNASKIASNTTWSTFIILLIGWIVFSIILSALIPKII